MQTTNNDLDSTLVTSAGTTLPLKQQQQMMMYPPHQYAAPSNQAHYQQHLQFQYAAAYQQQKQRGGSGGDDVKTLWVGNLLHWMDETYLHSCFSHTNEDQVASVKVIRNKQTLQSEGYGFVEFHSRSAAEEVLQSFSGVTMPNADQPFRLNWASFRNGEQRASENGPDLSIFVGDLAPDVFDDVLLETFAARYPSVKGAKVVIDFNTGRSKGYGFVRFGDKSERSRAITEMNGAFCSSRQMRVGAATLNRAAADGQQNNSQAVTLAGGNGGNGSVAYGSLSDGESNNSTIFVGGLDADVTEEELMQPFSHFGKVVSVKIPVGKGCGFVQFANRKSAEESIQNLNGTVIGKNTVRLSWGRSPNKQVFVDIVKREAYENIGSLVVVDGEDITSPPPRSSTSLRDDEFSVVSNTNEVFGPSNERHASSSSLDYDVIIRYRRGGISNDDFISHLRAALSRRGISVHEDFDDVEAILGCRVLMIFLTSRCISSNLLNILEHQRREGRVVYPIFYGISPSDLINNSQNYESLLLQENPSIWQAALKEIARMPGYTLTDKSESELIDEIVRDVWKVLCSNASKKMIGMDIQVDKILSLLCTESPEVRSIGLWGTVGIGKTAIAEEIFRRISVHYETYVFFKDLHTEVELKGHDAVRVNFLAKVLEVDPHVIQISDIKTSFLRSRLQKKRVLVILDDVNDLRDVETFLGKLCYFGPGSRIIITSRNRHIFVQCKIDHIYEVKPLDISKSLLLLDRGIFQSVLSLDLVNFSHGNPLVLQFLSNREWKLLSEVQKTSPIYIPGIYERSCCGLDKNEMSIFLDIACFFRRMDKDNVVTLLDGCGFSAHVGFKSLVDKSLLTMSHNMVDMPRFIQATGREVVRREAIERPGDRSRLWNSDDIRDVFLDNTGTSAIEGIFLDMSKLYLDANPYIFEKMCNLRLLKFYCSEVTESHGVSLPQGLECLPSKLSLLHWEYYPLSSLPKSFDPKNLVELHLPSSYAKKLWRGKKSLEKLKKMRLSYSYQLTKIPRLSNAPNLEHIDLEGCGSLMSISQSICYLKKLAFLNLKDCSNLESIPSTIDLESLEILNISGCSKLVNFPEISPNVKELYLGGTMIQEIPSSIKNLVLLEKLDLENCRHLKNLHTSICKLKNLETINLSGCSSLERFPDLSRKMKCLRCLDLSMTAIKELPSSISYLTALEELRFVDCKNLVRLPDNAWNLRFKVEFREIDKEKFSRLWNKFGWLKKVKIS